MTVAPPQRKTRQTFAAAAASEAPPRVADLPDVLIAIPGGVVDGSEIILLAVKPSMFRPLFDALPWIVTCVALAVAMVWLRRPISGLSLSASAQAIMLVAMIRMGLAIIRWIPTWYILTNRRVICVRGVREPRITDCPLVDVRDTYLGASPLERATRLGTITLVVNDDARSTRLWQSIPRPEETHEKMRRAIRNATNQYSANQ